MSKSAKPPARVEDLTDLAKRIGAGDKLTKCIAKTPRTIEDLLPTAIVTMQDVMVFGEDEQRRLAASDVLDRDNKTSKKGQGTRIFAPVLPEGAMEAALKGMVSLFGAPPNTERPPKGGKDE